MIETVAFNFDEVFVEPTDVKPRAYARLFDTFFTPQESYPISLFYVVFETSKL
jgi:hypothetical protein